MLFYIVNAQHVATLELSCSGSGEGAWKAILAQRPAGQLGNERFPARSQHDGMSMLTSQGVYVLQQFEIVL